MSNKMKLEVFLERLENSTRHEEDHLLMLLSIGEVQTVAEVKVQAIAEAITSIHNEQIRNYFRKNTHGAT